MNDIVVVGGGLSGLLITLKLTQYNSPHKVTLLEEQPTLGGRLFFATYQSFLGKNRDEIFDILNNNTKNSHGFSGFGFEEYDLQTKESLFRHIQNALNENEILELEKHIAQFNDLDSLNIENNIYFVKKEITNSNNIINMSSEIFTKKEADFLKFIITADNFEDDSIVIQSWQSLGKSSKETFNQLFECIIGFNWESLQFKQCCVKIKEFFSKKMNNYFLPFQRKVGLELKLQEILQKRGVEIKTLCKLLNVEKNSNLFFNLTIQDEVCPLNQKMETQKLILAIPLSKMAGIMPKEFYSPEQSKFMTKIQPQSLVVYELSPISQIKGSHLTHEFFPQEHFIYPVERAKSFYTEDDRMLFYTELDFEESMQAPTVKEAVGRLKRAASRILNEASAQEIKKGFRIPQAKLVERVILLPIAKSIPDFQKINFELKQVKMGVSQLYCCGDSFFSLATEPWKRIIHSVMEVSHSFI